jgi:hypothetical protein
MRRSHPSSVRLAIPAVALGFLSLFLATAAAGEAGRLLTLSQALVLTEQRGFDALLAEAATRGAAGDLVAARQLANPAFSGASPCG